MANPKDFSRFNAKGSTRIGSQQDRTYSHSFNNILIEAWGNKSGSFKWAIDHRQNVETLADAG
jgi:hypothetical protein